MNLANPSPVHYVTVDAKQAMRARVNEHDIASGVPGDPENCAIALAFKRKLSKKMKGVSVRVFRTSVWVGHEASDGETVIELYDLDGDGKNLVASMDTTKTAYPTTVTLLPRRPSKQKAALAAKNKARAARIAAGIPANPKYHRAGGAKSATRTLAGIRSGSGIGSPAHP